MVTNPVLTYCYFAFDDGQDKHHLRVRVTRDLDLVWRLQINDNDVGSFTDKRTNVLIVEQVIAALSYANVIKIYNELLNGQKPTSHGTKQK